MFLNTSAVANVQVFLCFCNNMELNIPKNHVSLIFYGNTQLNIARVSLRFFGNTWLNVTKD